MELEADVVTIVVTLVFMLVILMAFFFGDWFSLRRIFGDKAGRDVEVTGAMATTLETYDGSARGNFFRLCILILDYASEILRGVLQEELEKKYPGLELEKVLDDQTVRDKLFNLKGAFNHQHQQKLYPNGKNGNPSTSVTVGDLDITLTVLLLRNITKLDTKSKAWENPLDSDTSKEAEIGRVKKYRNVDYAHIKEAAISLDDFREKFSGLKSSLLALSGRYSGEEYDAILREPLDDDSLKDYQDDMKILYQYDKEVKELMMENHDMLKKIYSRTICTDEKVQLLHDKLLPDSSEHRISPGSKLDPTTTTTTTEAGARNQVPETSPTESKNEEIAKFYIKCMSEIQRLPWDPNDTMHIDDVFVNLGCVQEERKPARSSSVPIHSYTSIFKDTEQGKTPKRILVKGKAGIGKTTFTQKMATDWANATLASRECDELLSKYKHVLILNLRSIQPGQTLKEVMETQITCSAENRKAVTDEVMQAINRDTDHVLLVFDGYDEYDINTSTEITDIIYRRRYQDVCTVITTRPWKAEQLMNRRIIDGVYEITGLTEDNIVEYVANFFNDKQTHEKYLALKSHWESHFVVWGSIGKGLVGYLAEKKLMSLVKIPILLLFICLMWQEDQESVAKTDSLPNSYTLLYKKLIQLLVKRRYGIRTQDEMEQPACVLKLLKETFISLGKLLYMKLIQLLLRPIYGIRTQDEMEQSACVQKLEKETFISLGKLTYDGLMKPDGGLIFNEKDLQTIPDIKELYSLGLLSESKVHINLDVKHEITFPHKTIQEFFAAKYLARKLDENDSNILDQLLQNLDTPDKLCDMEFVLRFLCGLSREATSRVLHRAKSVHGEYCMHDYEMPQNYDDFLEYIEWYNALLLEHWYAHCSQETVLPHELISCHTPLCIPDSFEHSDPKFQQVLQNSMDSPHMFSGLIALGFYCSHCTSTGSFETEHKLLSLLNKCGRFEKLMAVFCQLFGSAITCDECTCALNSVISKAPNLQLLILDETCSGALSSMANPGKLICLTVKDIYSQNFHVVKEMQHLKIFGAFTDNADVGDETSKDLPPLLGALPNISHNLTRIVISDLRLRAVGVQLLGGNLHHVPGLEHLQLERVFKGRSECGPNRCTCPRGEDTTDYDRCQDVCEAVRELSQGVIHTTKLKYFSFRSNHLGQCHGITSPLIALIQSLSTVSVQTGMKIDMEHNDLGSVDRLSELIEAIVSTYQHVSFWELWYNNLEKSLPMPDDSLKCKVDVDMSLLDIQIPIK